jgi:hypothetical protein
VESGSTFDGVALLGEGGASLVDDIVEFLDVVTCLLTIGSSTSAHLDQA